MCAKVSFFLGITSQTDYNQMICKVFIKYKITKKMIMFFFLTCKIPWKSGLDFYLSPTSYTIFGFTFRRRFRFFYLKYIYSHFGWCEYSVYLVRRRTDGDGSCLCHESILWRSVKLHMDKVWTTVLLTLF